MNLPAGFVIDNHRHSHLFSLPPSTCDLHPDEVVTGFCASCLRDRLTALEPSSVNSSSARRKSTSCAVRSLFSRSATAAAASFSGSNNSAAAELRRCKSFSVAPRRPDILSFEPQRHSCHVRGHGTLYALFYQHDRDNDLGPSAAPVLEEGYDDEIRAAEPTINQVRKSNGSEDIAIAAVEEEAKPMKEHIDIESYSKKPPPPQRDFKEIAGSFWVAASVFSKKLQQWRRKQKVKKQQQSSKRTLSKMQSSRRFDCAQSEIGVDAAGRRSCDVAPRFSLDARRMSFDEPRFSWDAPRASWDGYSIGGGRLVFPRNPPMVSVVENNPSPPMIRRSDGQIPVEEDGMIPGGTSQTRDYYLDSSSQRCRRSLDRSTSIRRPPLEVNSSSNEPMPAVASSELFNSCYNEDDRSESFESVYRDSQKNSANSGKKSKRWSKGWSLWGFIHWRSGSGGRGGARGGESFVIERSLSESWPELRRNEKMLRCNSNVSSRHSFSSTNSGFGSMRGRLVDINGHGQKKMDEFVLERNRSLRYSASNVDNNGLLRCYLTPMRGSRQNGGPSLGKNKNRNSESSTRTMLRMY